MKKRFVSILLVLCMVLCLAPTVALAESAPAGTALTQELMNKHKDGEVKCISLPEGEYYLESDIYLVGDDADPNSAWPLNITAGDVTIDLNGHVLDLRGSFIYLTKNLTLKDSSTAATHKFRVEDSGLWVWDEKNGTETVTGGVITGGSGAADPHYNFGGGVSVYGGTFTMEGGSIVGCTADNGGGVYVYGSMNNSGTFHMEGGSIVGCTANNGGGAVADSYGTFTMNGGSIRHCRTNGEGGGVYVANSRAANGEFIMNGGSIEACSAADGGGVGGTSGTFRMEDGSIKDCTANNGGGVYVGSAVTFTMNGGSIAGCSADRAGGGVFVSKDILGFSSAGTFTMNGDSITGCTANGVANAVHADGTFENNQNIDKSLLTGINAGHTGAVDDPILIGSAAGLKDFRDRVNNGETGLCARLTCDIVLNDGTIGEDGKYENGSAPVGWTPIGTSSNRYSGTFDGGGHTIKGLYAASVETEKGIITVIGIENAGLFGYVKGAAKIQDLTVEGYVKGKTYAGGIVGYASYDYGKYPEIIGCTNKCIVQAVGDSGNPNSTTYAGGIVGYADMQTFGGNVRGIISNCVNHGIIHASNTDDKYANVYAGGIVGYGKAHNYSDGTATMEIINCANHAAITAYRKDGNAYAGGIAGRINGDGPSDQKINGSFNAGKICASSDKGSACAGGIIGEAFNGRNAESPIIANCLNVGEVTGVKGSTNAGGIAGKAYRVPISNCCNAGKVDGNNDGGIAGSVDYASVSDCYYLEGTADCGYNVTHKEGLKTRAEFADGTVLELLQNGDANSPWTKTGYLEVAKLRLPLLFWQTADAHEHNYEWQSGNGQYWQVCKLCGLETAKQDIPTVHISGADKVCRTQDYSFSFTLPEGVTDAGAGYGFTLLGSDVPLTEKDGVYTGTVKAEWYDAKENAFVLTVNAQTADGFVFSVEKTVTIQNEHTGGEATCTEKAVCDVCGESYGELDANNHADLRHVEAKAATKTAEGNIEHWYCEDCGKYYKDAEATQEITKEATVTAKLTDGKTPQTGDGSNLTVWLALLLVSSAGILAVTCGKKKHREN